MIVARRVRQVLASAGIKVHDFIAGNFAVCQEMAGCSVTLLRLDDEMKQLYDSPGWTMLFGARGRTAP
jgi:dihydroxyacetone kinase-like protein